MTHKVSLTNKPDGCKASTTIHNNITVQLYNWSRMIKFMDRAISYLILVTLNKIWTIATLKRTLRATDSFKAQFLKHDFIKYKQSALFLLFYIYSQFTLLSIQQTECPRYGWIVSEVNVGSDLIVNRLYHFMRPQ